MSILGDAVVIGSGGETASIFAKGNVLSTDTVTLTKGGKSYSGVWTTISADSGFLFDKLKEYGTYTMTAMRGELTAEYTIVVDSAAQFAVNISEIGDWEVYWYIENKYGYFLSGDKGIGNGQVAGQILRRSIIFPVSGGKTIALTKALSTTMRIGFLATRSASALIANMIQTTGTSISATAPSNATYCVIQLCTNGDVSGEGTASTGTHPWSEITFGLKITKS